MTKESSIRPANPFILTIDGGSSSIKFALFEADDIVLILAGVVPELTAVAIAWRFRNESAVATDYK